MDGPKITKDMTLSEAYEIMKTHYPQSEYYIDMGKKSLYIGLDDLISILKENDLKEGD